MCKDAPQAIYLDSLLAFVYAVLSHKNAASNLHNEPQWYNIRGYIATMFRWSYNLYFQAQDRCVFRGVVTVELNK